MSGKGRGGTPKPARAAASAKTGEGGSARTARRARMAARKVAGQTIKSIARDEKLSRNWTAQELASAESRQFIAAMVDAYRDRVRLLFEKTLTMVEEALQARNIVNFQGVALDIGPDHYARLAAGKRYLELVLAGRAAPKAPAEAQRDRTITYEQLLEIVNAKQAIQ